MAAEERERNIDEERSNIDAEARERAEVAERRWHEALAKVAAMRQCPPREVNDAPRKRGRPRKSEEAKAATAEIRKLRKQRGDAGASVRREKTLGGDAAQDPSSGARSGMGHARLEGQTPCNLLEVGGR